MADAPLPPEQTNMQQEPDHSPASTPPDQETKLSRKREREVSLEPASTPPRDLDADSRNEVRGTRTPAKKNRRTYTDLDPTEEEDDNAMKARRDSESPPLSTSPPAEMKIRVRQISQGVEDLSWKNAKSAQTQTDTQMEGQTNTLQPAPTIIEEPKNEQQTQTASAFEVQVTSVETQTEEQEPQPPTTTPPYLETDGSDKNLKRKFLERGTSVGPPDATDSHGSSEPLKRPRDDSDKDDNPREGKRPSPPPEQPKSPKSPKKAPPSSKFGGGGFMAYASNSSPFASVKGKNLFTKAASPSPPPTQAPSSLAPSPFLTQSHSPASGSGPNSLNHTPAPKFGFEAFASSTSPFSSFARSTSPVLGSTAQLGEFGRGTPSVFSSSGSSSNLNASAFANYASGTQSFAAFPSSQGSGSAYESKKSVFASNGNEEDQEDDDSNGDEEDPRGASSFGDKLRAGKDEGTPSDDEESKPILEHQETITGEEEEQTIHQVRGKLYALAGSAWKERGIGTLRLNVRRTDGHGARLVMRKEAVYSLLLNVPLFSGMRVTVAQDPRYLRFSAIENGQTTHYNLKLPSAKIAQGLVEEINANIPP